MPHETACLGGTPRVSPSHSPQILHRHRAGHDRVAIAANMLIFALVRSILLRPLPISGPDHLVQLEEVSRDRPGQPLRRHFRGPAGRAKCSAPSPPSGSARPA